MKQALDRLLEIGQPSQWTEFASITKLYGKRRHTVNVIRHLKRAGYVEDITPKYKPGEEYTGPRYSMYKITPLGLRAALSGNRERA